MITCKKATELISKSADGDLTLGETIRLNFHLFICEFCEQFKKQLGLIHKVIGILAKETEAGAATGAACLSPEDKKKMLERITGGSK